jgi:hypothetical protein
LAGSLPSTLSATACAALFVGFTGTTRPSDFPHSFIAGLRPQTFRRGPRVFPLANTGSPGSRSWCLRACSGPQTARGPFEPCDYGSSSVAFRFAEERRHPGMARFHGSIPCPHIFLSTLRHGPCDPPRMTRIRDEFAISFPGGTFTHNTTPVSTGALSGERSEMG